MDNTLNLRQTETVGGLSRAASCLRARPTRSTRDTLWPWAFDSKPFKMLWNIYIKSSCLRNQPQICYFSLSLQNVRGNQRNVALMQANTTLPALSVANKYFSFPAMYKLYPVTWYYSVWTKRTDHLKIVGARLSSYLLKKHEHRTVTWTSLRALFCQVFLGLIHTILFYAL